MKILIAGATGFIGSNILNYFKKTNNSIFALYFKKKPWIKSKNIKWVKGDLKNFDFCKKVTKNIDVVIQCAATTSGAKDIINSPYLHVTDNAVINSYLLQSCYNNKVKHFIFFSCTVMYQNSKKPLRESDFNPSQKIYEKYFGVANTKLFVEKLCEFYSKLNRTKFSIVRHSNIYGPYDKYDLDKSHFFGASITKVMKAKNEIIIWGKGLERRDILHVEDLVNFVKKIILNQKSKFEIFNCGYGKDFKVIDIIKKIIKISNKNIKIKHDLTKPSINTSLSLNCSKAKKLLKWSRRISLNQGILKTLNWYKKNVR
jgi:GDP-L-fucose synthase